MTGGGSRHCAVLMMLVVPLLPVEAEHVHTDGAEFALGLYAPSHAYEQPCPAPIPHPDEQSFFYVVTLKSSNSTLFVNPYVNTPEWPDDSAPLDESVTVQIFVPPTYTVRPEDCAATRISSHVVPFTKLDDDSVFEHAVNVASTVPFARRTNVTLRVSASSCSN